MSRDSGQTFAWPFQCREQVDEKAAMQILTVYACVRLLAESIAALPLHLYRLTDDNGNKEKARFLFLQERRTAQRCAGTSRRCERPEPYPDSWEAALWRSQCHRVAVLEEGMAYKPISLPPRTASFLETKKFSDGDLLHLPCLRIW